METCCKKVVPLRVSDLFIHMCYTFIISSRCGFFELWKCGVNLFCILRMQIRFQKLTAFILHNSVVYAPIQ